MEQNTRPSPPLHSRRGKVLRHFLGRVRPAGLRRVWKSKILSVFYLLAIVMSFGLEHIDEIAARIWGEDIKNSKWLRPGLLYQAVTKAGYRRPRAHYVRVVTVDPDKEPQDLEGNECRSRFFEARLLDAISTAHPALIALDEYFPAGDCVREEDKQYTQKLKDALRRVTKLGIPVVIADNTLNEEERLKHRQSQYLNGSPLKSYEVVEEPRVQFDGEDGDDPKITYGNVHRDPDTRRIPTSWATYVSQDDIDTHARLGDKDVEIRPFHVYGFAFQVASVYDDSRRLQSELEELDDLKENPFTSFLEIDQFEAFEALDVLCGHARTDKAIDWENCSSSNYAMNSLAGHIVLVGDVSTKEDIHPSVFGDINGCWLIANYIESVLDDRILFAVPWWIELLLSLLLFGVIEIIFRLLEKSPLVALGIAFIVVLCTYVTSYLIVLGFGYYMYIWIPGLVAILGEFVSLLVDTQPKTRRRHRASLRKPLSIES